MPETIEMAKRREADKMNVKLPAELHRTAKAVAAYMGMELGEYIAQIVQPVVDRDLDRMAADRRDSRKQDQ